MATWRRGRPLDRMVHYYDWPGKLDYIEMKGIPKINELAHLFSVVLPLVMVIVLASYGRNNVPSVSETASFALATSTAIVTVICAIIQSMFFKDNTWLTRSITVGMYSLSLGCGLAFLTLYNSLQDFNILLALFLVWILSPLFSATNPLILKF